jgi:peptidoglycan L-alanyl-D-glutamate endopeptidase CwlK
MSRSLDDLRPEIRALVDPWLSDCQAQGIYVLVTSTLRSNEDQAVLYAQGRTTPGNIVTNAKPGQSAHNYGLALDIVPLIHGKPDWSGNSPIWTEIANLGQARGLQWLGAPDSSFHELAHFQLPNWKALAGLE